jgi:tRNA threonylcarbamoyladenosine biosynthesis protein TsaB
MKPFLVAFDTATEHMAIAVRGPGGTRLCTAPGGAQASAALLPTVEAMMAEVGLRYAGVGVVAFGRGPGAFTGLRTACAAAQGLALGIGCPVLSIDSLALVAEDARAQCEARGIGCDEVSVAMDARMDEAYVGAWRWSDGAWHLRRAPALFTLPALQALWHAEPPSCVAGNATAAFAGRLDADSALRLETEHDRAAALLRLADAAWVRGEVLDAADALPAYVRDKVALTTAERAAAQPAAAAAPPGRPDANPGRAAPSPPARLAP